MNEMMSMSAVNTALESDIRDYNAVGVKASQVGSVNFGYAGTPIYDLCNAYYHYYPVPYFRDIVIEKESKFDKAFKIVQKLMEKDMVKVDKVKDFVKLVGEIAELV